MKSRINYTLVYGSINTDLRVDFSYVYDTDPENKYKSIREYPEHNSTYIRGNYSITISEGFGKARLFIPGGHMTCVLDILTRTIKAVGEHYKELYPHANLPEYDIDKTALDKFNREHTVLVNGYTAVPCIYANSNNECNPALRISSKRETVVVPLTDAIIIAKKLDVFDADTFGMMLLNMLR